MENGKRLIIPAPLHLQNPRRYTNDYNSYYCYYWTSHDAVSIIRINVSWKYVFGATLKSVEAFKFFVFWLHFTSHKWTFWLLFTSLETQMTLYNTLFVTHQMPSPTLSAVLSLSTTRCKLRKVLFLALSVTFLFFFGWFFGCESNISGTAERICAKITEKTCLVPRSDEFECRGRRSTVSPGTKTRCALPSPPAAT